MYGVEPVGASSTRSPISTGQPGGKYTGSSNPTRYARRMGRGARLPPQAMPAAAQKAINRVDARSPTDIERRFQCPHNSTGERFEVCATASSRLTQTQWQRAAQLETQIDEKTAYTVRTAPRDKRWRGEIRL